MTEKHHNSTIHDRVLGQIDAGKAKMRPKSYFVAHTTLVFAVISLTVLLSIYLASFAVFVLRYSGAWYVPAFGREGVWQFFASVPWILVALLAVCISILEILMRRHTVAYRKPLLLSLGGVFILVCTVGVLVGYTAFHNDLLTRARGNRLPLVGPVYRDLCSRHVNNVEQGVVVSVQEHGFCIHDALGNLIAFVTNPKTKFSHAPMMERGDKVVVFSKRHEEIVRALGVRKIARDEQVRQMADATIKEISERCRVMLK